jgi:hypothetical protein
MSYHHGHHHGYGYGGHDWSHHGKHYICGWYPVGHYKHHYHD